MKFNKGQGALEYLLLIGGAVLIAVIVIALLVGMGSSSKTNAQDSAAGATSAMGSVAVAPIIYSDDCTGAAADELMITYNGGTITATIDGVAATIITGTHPTIAGQNAPIGITGLCDGTSSAPQTNTVVLTATNDTTGTTARSNAYTYTDATD